MVGRPGEQAAAARQRDALSGARRLAEGDPDAHEMGRPEGQAPGRGRAAAVPRDVGHRAERAPLPRVEQIAEGLGDPREAAPSPQREARRVVGLAHARRPHDPRDDAPCPRRRVRPMASPSGATQGVRRSREVHRGHEGERAVAHGSLLRALVGGDRRSNEDRRQKGERRRRGPTRSRTCSASATSRRWCTSRCPTRPRASTTCWCPP